MQKERLQEIADRAYFIVNGYAFTETENGFVSILNLEHPECAMVTDLQGQLIETNMDEIETQIVLDLCKRNLQFLGA